ncbi:AAA family ATPase [Chloroflexota bacterium]
MPDTMQILGWKAEGFRCPDHEIDFCDNSNNPNDISLIQMPNGTGKTTTLILLRAALSGNANTWSAEQIQQMKKRNTQNQTGVFTLRLLLNGQLITIIMDFNFENNKVTYKTTGPSGQDQGFQPPRAFTKFMKPDFVNYYAFDGELAQNLLERTHTDAIAVIERLFSFNLLDYMATKIDDYWEAQTRNVTAKDEKGRSQRFNTALRLKQRLERLEKAKEKLDENRIKVDTDLRQKRAQYETEVAAMQGQSSLLDQNKLKLAECEEQIKVCTKLVLHSMADPPALSASFAVDIKDFKASLDRVKLPESAAREFFDELAEEDNCVCGRPIDESIKNAIKERSAQYLGAEEFSLLNSMKTVVEEAVGPSLEEPELQLKEQIERLSSWVRAREAARNELNELEIEAEHQDPKVAEAKGDIERLEEDLTKIDSQLRKFQDGEDQDEDTTDIEILRTKFQQALFKLAEITNTTRLMQ